MIPVLYTATETSFVANGIGLLKDCTKCIVTEELNGIYECEFSYPITGQFYSEIAPDRIIKVKANETSSLQLFRVYRNSKPINGVVKQYCQHISYDLNMNVITPFTQSQTNATAALNAILDHCYYTHRFSAVSSSSTQSSMEVIAPISARKCLGGIEGSFLDKFKGEFEFDNFIIRHYTNRGQDNGVTIQYGKNLTDITADTSIENTYTAIYPYATDEDGDYYELPEKVIALQSASNYGEPRVLPIDLSNKFDSETRITAALLRQYANEYLTNNAIDSISKNLKISFVQLWQSKEYETVALLERVKLGDIVTVKYPALGVSVKAKVIKTVYDALQEKYIEIELGQAKNNFANTLNKVSSNFQAMSDFMKNQPSLMEKAIQNATNLITGQTGGYVVLNQDDATNLPNEILIMNEPTIEAATKLWRWNLGGLGYSSGANAYSGQYRTAITMDGAIVADFITTGTLNADLIRAGVIRDVAGKNYWNMVTGEFHLSSDATSDVLDDLTQQQVFDTLTNSSANQGIYLQNGTLMLNASYIQTGNLSADRITTGSMSANRITTGTLDASQVNVTNLNASNITSGTIDASQINVINLDASSISSGNISANRITTGTLQSTSGNTYFNLSTGIIGCNLSNGLKMRLSVTGLKLTDSNENELVTIYGTVGENNSYGQVIANYGEFKALRIHSTDNARVSIVNIASDNSLYAVNGISSDMICVKADNSSSNIGSFSRNAQNKSVLAADIANVSNISVGNTFQATTTAVSIDGHTLNWIPFQDGYGHNAYILGYYT